MAICLCSIFPLLYFLFLLFVSSSLLLCCSSLFVRGARDGNFDRDWSLQHFESFPRSAVRTRLMVTDGFVRVFALVSMFPSWSRWYVLPSPASFLLLSYFFLWSLRTSHQAITPSHHHSIFPLPLLPWPGGMREAIIQVIHTVCVGVPPA